MFAESAYARRRRWKPGHFSFNTREGQCPTCRGLGHIDLDVQYLPDITVECPTCHGARFNDATLAVRIDGLTVADVLGLSVHDALERFADRAPVAAALRPVSEVGLGYLRLGEPTPSLSGGESQRLRIASRLRSSQRGALYVFDEPSTGLHPLDVATLVGVFDRLLDAGATIIVIDHDLDLLAAADHLIDMGPGGGPDGGHIVAAGTPEDVARDPDSVTGPWLAEHLGLPLGGGPAHETLIESARLSSRGPGRRPVGYATAMWLSFGEALAAVAGALTGLLFVAVSVKSDALAASRSLSSRATQTLVLFMTSVLVAVLLVAPQPRAALGSELLAVAAVSGTALLILDRRAGHSGEQGVARYIERFSPNTITAVLVGVAGVTFLARAGGGLYWLIPAAVASLVGGVVNAWLFLIKVAPPPTL